MITSLTRYRCNETYPTRFVKSVANSQKVFLKIMKLEKKENMVINKQGPNFL
jgi:hypothetical protein